MMLGMKFKRMIVALVGVVAIGALVGFLAVWVQGLPGPYHGAYIARGLLHNIYDGLQDYDEVNGNLPPSTATKVKSGKQVSWRIEVYQSWVRHGFIDVASTNNNTSVKYDRNKAWNDPNNLRLEGRGFSLFAPHSHPQQPSAWGSFTTYYKAITGPGTAFDSGSPPSLKDLPKGLILVVRVERSDTHWMEPGDLDITHLGPNEETKRLLLGKDGYVVLFADGEGWVLSGKTPISDLCKFFTIEGAKKFDRDKLLGPYRILPR